MEDVEKRLAILFMVCDSAINGTVELVVSVLPPEKQGGICDMLVEYEVAKMYCFWSLSAISNHYQEDSVRREVLTGMISFFNDGYGVKRDDIQKYFDADGTRDQYLLLSKSISDVLSIEEDAILMLQIFQSSTALLKTFIPTFKKSLDFPLD